MTYRELQPQPNPYDKAPLRTTLGKDVDDMGATIERTKKELVQCSNDKRSRTATRKVTR